MSFKSGHLADYEELTVRVFGVLGLEPQTAPPDGIAVTGKERL
jgi:hypothetical protein